MVSERLDTSRCSSDVTVDPETTVPFDRQIIVTDQTRRLGYMVYLHMNALAPSWDPRNDDGLKIAALRHFFQRCCGLTEKTNREAKYPSGLSAICALLYRAVPWTWRRQRREIYLSSSKSCVTGSKERCIVSASLRVLATDEVPLHSARRADQRVVQA